MLLDECFDDSEVLAREAVVPGQLDLRAQPELGLSVTAVHVDVDSRLLTREKEKPEASFPENRWTHGLNPPTWGILAQARQGLGRRAAS